MNRKSQQLDEIIDISDELDDRRQRWRFLAEGSEWVDGKNDVEINHCEPNDPKLDVYAAAAFYIRDAQHGCKMVAHIHTAQQLEAVALVRSKVVQFIFNSLCYIQLLLPAIELPMGWECNPTDAATMESSDTLCTPVSSSLNLIEGWTPTMLGSSWLELTFCIFFLFEIRNLSLIRDSCSGNPFWKTNIWAAIRLGCVILQMLDIAIFIGVRYIYAGTSVSLYFFRWSRALFPLIYMSNHQYLRLFLKGFCRVLPRLLPVAVVTSFVVCFYGFIGYLAFSDTRADDQDMQALTLFLTLPTSILTGLRMFTSIVFILDLEFLYYESPGIRVYCLSFGLLAAVLLCALVTSVANKLYQQQSLEAYQDIMKKRAWSLAMAYNCLADKEGCVTLDSWINLMAKLRPDLSKRGCELLFRITTESNLEIDSPEGKRAQFYEMCALAEASVGDESSSHSVERSSKICHIFERMLRKIRRFCVRLLCLHIHKINVHQIVHDIAVVLQAVQLVFRSIGDNDGKYQYWISDFGVLLLLYFWGYGLVMLFGMGTDWALKDWQWQLGMMLNVLGVVDIAHLWTWSEKLYLVLMGLRVLNLWRTLCRIQKSYSDVIEKFGLVMPTLIRSISVLLAVVYSMAWISYGLLWHTAVGVAYESPLVQSQMMARWDYYNKIIGFDTFNESLITTLDTLLLGNWTFIMDAAVVAIGWPALCLFYAFKLLTLYFIQPVLVGFIVQSWMGIRVSHSQSDLPLSNIPSSNNSVTSDEGSNAVHDDDADEFNGCSVHGNCVEEDDPRAKYGIGQPQGSGRGVVRVAPVQRAISTQFWGAQHSAAQQNMELQGLQGHVGSLQEQLAKSNAESLRLREILETQSLEKRKKSVTPPRKTNRLRGLYGKEESQLDQSKMPILHSDEKDYGSTASEHGKTR